MMQINIIGDALLEDIEECKCFFCEKKKPSVISMMGEKGTTQFCVDCLKKIAEKMVTEGIEKSVFWSTK